MGRELTPNRIAPFTSGRCLPVVLCGISTCFQVLSPCLGQIAHALLTRPPLEHPTFQPKPSAQMSPLDLHVLSTPPAFVLSQDQTLMFNPLSSLAALHFRLAKAFRFPQQIRRLLSQKSDCSLLLDLLRCIVFKDRRCRLNCCSRDNVDDYSKNPNPCQAVFSTFFAFNTNPDFPSKSDGFQPDSSRIGWI